CSNVRGSISEVNGDDREEVLTSERFCLREQTLPVAVKCLGLNILVSREVAHRAAARTSSTGIDKVKA
ncbi:hypothetical protein JW921_08640, partial [Candidatus Fermentibacterales bacterium]|nr:hypothetical protein [Candidatus Fermentibacterales bacterium]